MRKKGFVFGIVILFLAGSLVPSIGGFFKKFEDIDRFAALDNNLIGCWHFDEGSGNTAYDSTGNNDGTIYGAQWVGGISGNALWFDGDDDYIRIFNTSDFEFVNQSFSFHTWVKILDNTNDYRIFICIGDTDVPPVVFLGKCRSGIYDGRIIFEIFNSNYEPVICLSNDNGDTLPKDKWMHVAGVADYENNSISLYINGTFQESQPIVDINLSESQNLRVLFGNYSRIPEYIEHNHYGVIDEVYIYNRALSAEEILEYYEGYYPVTTVYIDDNFDENTSGWGYDHFDKIQDGIDAVNEDGTVFVYSGTYYENVVVDKKIDLVGEDNNSTIIDGSGVGDVVYISADNVSISKFTIQNSGGPGSPTHNTGIDIRSNNNIISSNNIKSNNDYGIIVYGSSSYNKIIDNIISSNHANGIHIQFSSNFNEIETNNISLNGHSGIHLEDTCTNNKIVGNNIASNYRGISIVEFCSSNIFIDNIISSNIQHGIYIDSYSNENFIYHNNFINNTYNANDDSNNIWDNGYPSGGNYWDDYIGVDNYHGPNQDIHGSDGIGDTPYPISGGDKEDKYPLMHPWGENPPVANFTYSNDTSYVLFDGSSSYDRDGVIVFYKWEFRDGWIDFGEIVSHKFCDIGTYDVTLTVKDDDLLKDNITKSVEVILANTPPLIPEISGPNIGEPGVEYDYVFLVADPDDEHFMLWVDWGDGDNTSWIGPYSSGELVELSHMWWETGTYTIKAKLKDMCYDSAWGTFEVTMPRNRAWFNDFLIQLLGRFPLLQKLLYRLVI